MPLAPFLLALVLQGTPASAPATPPAPQPSAPQPPAPGSRVGPSLPSVPNVPEIVDRVVAIVNDQVITQSELEARVLPQIATAGLRDAKRLAEIRSTELRFMARDLLLTQAARRLAIDEAQITERVNTSIAEDVKKAGGEAQLRRNIEAQGKSYVEYERDKRNSELAFRLQAAELGFEARPENEIALTPSVLRAYYREHAAEFLAGAGVRGSMIWVGDDRTGSRPASRAIATELRRGVVGGESFTLVARNYPPPPRVAVSGRPAGDLGWIERGSRLDPKVEEFFFSNEPGTIGPELELEGGVAILRVEETRPAGPRPFQDPETQRAISERLYSERTGQILERLFLRLHREAYLWPRDLFGGL